MTTPYPPWAKWIAQDEDGVITVWKMKPIPIDGDTFLNLHGRWHSTYESIDYPDKVLIWNGKPNPHWRNSLDCLGEDDETI